MLSLISSTILFTLKNTVVADIQACFNFYMFSHRETNIFPGKVSSLV